MPSAFDFERLTTELATLLRRNGPLDAATACRLLRISQPSFSRLVRHMPGLIRLGRARRTRYLLARSLERVDTPIPIYEVSAHEGTRPALIAVLHPVHPRGFFVKSAVASLQDALHEDLPWFLDGMRPSGFLGRLVPRQLANEGFSPDIQRWSTDETLRYLTTWGWNLPGNLVVGDRALQLLVEHTMRPPEVIDQEDVQRRYVELADGALEAGVPGSSAAGEQPKFLATLRSPDGVTPVIVKFSPRRTDAISRRIADLLVCEHLAHRVLSQHGRPGVSSRIVDAGERTFLEMVRFDRIGVRHRRGIVTLLALDSEYVGSLERWSETADALLALRLISPQANLDVRWLEVFGGLIANTDMHQGNLSLFCSALQLETVAPAYDMLPMFFAPHHNQLRAAAFVPPPPRPADVEVWGSAHRAALDFWQHAADEPRISRGFRELARTARKDVDGLAAALDLLPAHPLGRRP